MKAIFLLIFCAVFAVANCDISRVAALYNGDIIANIKEPLINNSISTYKIKSKNLEPNKQLAISINAKFDTIVSVSFASATMAKFSYQISKTTHKNRLICDGLYLKNGYKTQDIKIKSGENLLITFGVDDIGLESYEFEADIKMEHISSNSAQNDASFENIYTQIIGREFEFNFITKQIISDFEVTLNNNYQIYKSSSFSGGAIRATIPNLDKIDYKNLYFVAKFRDKNGVKKEIKSENFTARVAKFELKNIPKILKGGVRYKDFKLIALDYNGAIVAGYNGVFKGDYISHSLQNCQANLASEIIEFRDGVGVISVDGSEFIYPDIGVARIEFVDWQNSDKARNACIINSFENIPNSDGKIGCNAGISKEIGYFHYDKIVHTKSEFKSKFGLFGVMEGNLSQAEYDDFMGIEAGLEFEARLADDSIAKLFSANCYASNIDFSNSSDLVMHALSKSKDKNHIYKSAQNIYTIDQNSFKNGVGKAVLKLSLPRDKPQNPLKITTENIDTNLTNNSNLSLNSKNSSQDHGYLYYAKAYGQKLLQASSFSHMAKIYFAIYCDSSCQILAKNSSEFEPILDKNMSMIGELKDYFVFKDFNASKGIVEFKTMPNSVGDVINGVLSVEINSEQKSEFEIKNIHFGATDFAWVRLFGDSGWSGVGDSGKAMGINGGQNIRYNRTIEW